MLVCSILNFCYIKCLRTKFFYDLFAILISTESYFLPFHFKDFKKRYGCSANPFAPYFRPSVMQKLKRRINRTVANVFRGTARKVKGRNSKKKSELKCTALSRTTHHPGRITILIDFLSTHFIPRHIDVYCVLDKLQRRYKSEYLKGKQIDRAEPELRERGGKRR